MADLPTAIENTNLFLQLRGREGTSLVAMSLFGLYQHFCNNTLSFLWILHYLSILLNMVLNLF